MRSAPPTDATTRLLLRRKEVRRRAWLRWLLVGLGVTVVAALVYVVGFSPVLAVTRVAVSGTDVATQDEVTAAAGVPLGTPMVRLDLAGIAERVSGLPPVAEVTVTRQWPDLVEIDVTERVARLAVESGTGYLIADATGVVFDTAKSLPKGLVRVEADPGDQQTLADAGVVFSSLSKATAERVASIEARGRDSITLRLRGGARVFWGSAEQSDLKAEVVDVLLEQGGSVFDVSAPAYPTRR